MRLIAHPIPYSSIVGGGFSLIGEDGTTEFIVNIRGTINGISKQQNDDLVAQLIELIKMNKGLNL